MHTAAAFLKAHGQKKCASAKTTAAAVCAVALQAVDEARADENGVFEPRMLSHSSDLVSLLYSWGGSIYWTGLLD